MNQEQQIKALAELDGAKYFDAHNVNYPYPDGTGYHNTDVKPYLTSYEAIIPLIQRQDVPTITRISLKLSIAQNETAKAYAWLKATPAQLCEALLRATGKWIE